MAVLRPLLPVNDVPCDLVASEPSVRGLTLQDVGLYVASGHCDSKYDLEALLLGECECWSDA